MNIDGSRVVIGAVNYGTSTLIKNWAASARFLLPNVELVIVDNYFSDEERSRCESITLEIGITLIKSENFGYGSSLNKIAQYFIETIGPNTSRAGILLFGNIDIIFKKIDIHYSNDSVAYLARGVEGKRQLNPFLNSIQRKFLPIHAIAIFFNSSFFLLLTTVFIKVLGFFDSAPWASHGSLFCINSRALKENAKIFNEESFLYSEELEFGSYLEKNGIPLQWSNVEYEHTAHVSTSKIIKNHRSFFKYWKPSFINWMNRIDSQTLNYNKYSLYKLERSRSHFENQHLNIKARSILDFKYLIVDVQRKLQSLLYSRSKSRTYYYSILFCSKTVGRIYLSEINNYRHDFIDEKAYELTIEIANEHKNKGYASMALKKVIERHPNVYAFVRINNIPSVRLFEKNGSLLYAVKKLPGILGSTYTPVFK
jgi:RimJ/RimL family protein N-acetyltransferase